MRRPPRPGIKSTQIFTYNQFRKVMTPDCFVQSIQSGLGEQPIKSMRDASVAVGFHRSLNQVQNVEYLEIIKPNEICMDGNIKNAINSRSFKIRNFVNIKQRGIKQNTIPIKPMHKPASSILNPTQPVHYINLQHISTLKFRNYPHNLQLSLIGDDIQYRKVSANEEKAQQFDEWAAIITQSIFYGSLLEETNILKLKNLIENLQKFHNGLNIILHLHSLKEIESIIHVWNDKKVGVDFVIWGKSKYFETINAFDLSQLGKIKKINRFMVFEDSHQLVRNLYYQCRQSNSEKNISSESEDQDETKIDWKSKYMYLKFNGLPNLMKFSQKFRISKYDEEMMVQKLGFFDQTEYIFKLEAIKQKIKVVKFRRKLKIARKPSRKSYSSKDMRSSIDAKCKNEIKQLDKNQDFKRKILQYAKILQDDQQKTNQLKSRSFQRKNSMQHTKTQGNTHKTNALKLINSQYDSGTQQPKYSHQIISQLLKNNAAISRQITKFQQKNEGINIQQLCKNNNF